MAAVFSPAGVCRRRPGPAGRAMYGPQTGDPGRRVLEHKMLAHEIHPPQRPWVGFYLHRDSRNAAERNLSTQSFGVSGSVRFYLHRDYRK